MSRLSAVVLVLGLLPGCIDSRNNAALPTQPSAVVTSTTTPLALPTITGTGTLTIESFTVVEFKYPRHEDWHYAPLVRVLATGGGVRLTRLDISIPGIGLPPSACTSWDVFAGPSVPLVGEIYGDYELTFGMTGRRAVEDNADMTLTYADATGAQRTVTARARIVPGSLPSTYTAGSGSPWFFCHT